MENKELIEWAIKGLESEVIRLDSEIYNGKIDLWRAERCEYRGNVVKLRERIQNAIKLKEQLDRKLFELKFERDLND